MASTNRETKRSGAKLWGVATGALAFVTAAAVAVTVATGDGATPAPTASSPVSNAPKDAASRGRVTGGVPVGYPRTADGAKAAAANYTIVRGSSIFLTNAKARHRAVEAMTSRDAASTATKEVDQSSKQAASGLRGDNIKLSPKEIIARTGVLSARTLAFDIHKATVRLWTTTVRGNAAGHATPKAAFRSVTVALVWEHDDWKLSNSSDTSGLLAPIDVRQAVNVTSDFADYVPGKAADAILSGTTGADGFPAPYERTEQGARAAATSAVTLWGDPRFFVSGDWRHGMLRDTVAPDALNTLTSDAESTAQLVSENRGLGEDGRTADGGLLVTRTATLATRAVAYSDQAASIELWTASVGGVAGKDETQRPQVAFLRMTVDLIWTGGSWKTAAVTPSEPLVPSPPATEQASSASSFVDVGGVSDAPPTA
ncbi:hypothetical protein ACFCY8_13170 [Streptomyces noursei]|uniref:hypothetical protein n=1 Tax=Streptomyces noursei TaxID=1971 RepID=UPI0035DA6ABF